MPSITFSELVQYYPWLAEIPDALPLIQGLIFSNASTAQIAAEVRNTDFYKQRFSGLLERQKQGLPAISEAEYLETERGYLNQLRSYGVDDLVGDFQAFAAEQIGFDVSVAELNARLDSGYAAVLDSTQQVRDAFEQFYGVGIDDQDLFRYFLDPEVGLREIENKVLTARIGGEALRYGLNITRSRSELLAASGVDERLAREGFADVARELPTLQRLAQIHYFTPLEQTELEDFFFHNDPEVGAQRQRTFTQALAEFQGSQGVRRNQAGGLEELVDFRPTV